MGAVGLGVRRLFGPGISGGALYFSALFKISDLGYGAWNGNASQVGALTMSDNTSFRLQVMVRSNSPSGYVLGMQKGGTGATSLFDTTERHAGETVLLVGKYDFTTAPHTATLWINPAVSNLSFGIPPTNGVSVSSGTDPVSIVIDRFNIRQNVASGASSVPAAIQWDELRLGSQWADVATPAVVTAQLSPSVYSTNGTFQFFYTNNSSVNGSIYTSTNLIDWTISGAAEQVAPGVYRFTEGMAENVASRFYQLRFP